MLRKDRVVAAALEPREWQCNVRAAAAGPDGRSGADAAVDIPACPLGWPPGVQVAAGEGGQTPKEADGRPCLGRPWDYWHCYDEWQLRSWKSSHSRYSNKSKSESERPLGNSMGGRWEEKMREATNRETEGGG